MKLFNEFQPSYHDPELWLRLGPAVLDEFENSAMIVLKRRCPTMDDYSYWMGYITALRWVLTQSKDLTKGADESARARDML